MSLRLRRVLVLLEDCSDRLLARGVVGGDVQEFMGGARFLAPQFVDQGFTVRPAEERTE